MLAAAGFTRVVASLRLTQRFIDRALEAQTGPRHASLVERPFCCSRALARVDGSD
jgi:hypothetical protein